MGFPDEKPIYLNVSRGKFNYKVGDEKRTAPFYYGKLVDIVINKDKYEEKEFDKVFIKMTDEGKDVTVTFRLEGWFSQGFFARFHGINVDEPFQIGVMPSKQNDKMSFCYVKQFGQTVKKDDNFPRPEKKEFHNTTVTDWSVFSTTVKTMLKEEYKKIMKEDVIRRDEPIMPPAQEDDLPF